MLSRGAHRLEINQALAFAIGISTCFFFQAEDGIRDSSVTGVQTCALPISRDASRLKDEFLATLSHELRTPLNAIVGYVRMMQSDLLTGEKRTRAMNTVARNVTSLTQIVEDVLDVSRIISGKLRLHVQPVDLAPVVHDAVETVRPAADAYGGRLATLVDPP